MSGNVPYEDHFPRTFCLLCPSANQFQHCHPRTSNLLTFFASDHDPTLEPNSWIWPTFARPVVGARRRQAYHPRQSGPLKGIERLPNELLDEILSLLADEKNDLLALGLSSPILWPVVLHRIHREYEKAAAMWAGKAVSFQGAGYMLDWLRAKSGFSESSHWPSGLTECLRTNLSTKTPVVEWSSIISSVDWEGFSDRDWADMKQDVSQVYMYPQDRVWVLRNLTTSQYIRSDKLLPTRTSQATNLWSSSRHGIAKISGYLQRSKHCFSRTSRRPMPDIPFDTTPLSFAHILLIFTCKSPQGAPYHAERPFGFHQWRWTGHSFDIVNLNVHTAETTASKWTDVSKLAVDEVSNLRYWVQRSGGFFNGYEPYHIWSRMLKERQMYRDWERNSKETTAKSTHWFNKPGPEGIPSGLQGIYSRKMQTRRRAYQLGMIP